MEDFCVEIAGPERAARLIELVRRFRGESGYAVDQAQAAAIEELCANRELGRAWLLIVDGDDVGYALAFWRHSIDDAGRVAHLDDLWIAPDFRGRGLGAKLLETACADMATSGARAVLLEADPASEATTRFYERAGFRRSNLALHSRSLRPT